MLSLKQSIEKMIENGLKQVSYEQLAQDLEKKGYHAKIGRSQVARVYNSSNKHLYSYNEVDIEPVCLVSGHSFANMEANRENLPWLQEYRNNHFCVLNDMVAVI